MICTDHWPGRLLGCAGHAAIRTPTLDSLAECGTRFTGAYSECPVCIPARRSQMTGTFPRTHEDRVYRDRLEMPAVPTLAQCFRDAGYQAWAAGKLHVYPQRNRIGFDDVRLGEEGRTQFGVTDDYELYLGDQGMPGAQWFHGMSNNEYVTRPWHLAEQHHVTNWTTRELVRSIKRRDPSKPALMYLSYCHPHPPLVPLQAYLDMYDRSEVDEPVRGAWSHDPQYAALRCLTERGKRYAPAMIRDARRAFYALCTHIDHQIRLVIGALREERMLNNTIIMFMSDHGDMLGNHAMWAKRVFYEYSANVPMLLIGPAGDSRVKEGATDDRLVCLADVMPTLLELCDIPIPRSVEGRSMIGDHRREYLYGEIGDGETLPKTRMIRKDRYKLIYYPFGNITQLFNLEADPLETADLANDPAHANTVRELHALLMKELYGGDESWVKEGVLVGLPEKPFHLAGNRGLHGQRTVHWP